MALQARWALIGNLGSITVKSLAENSPGAQQQTQREDFFFCVSHLAREMISSDFCVNMPSLN